MPSGDEDHAEDHARDGTPCPADGPTSLLSCAARAARTGLGLRGLPAGLARLLGLDFLALSAVTHSGLPELVWDEPSGGLGAELEELQFALGDGPTLEAAPRSRPLAEPDLAATDPARWPAFLPEAVNTAVRAVVAVPLLLGVATVGVLTGYRTSPGALTDTQWRDLRRLSRTLVALLLDTADAAPADETGPRSDLVLRRAEIHQATGYLSDRLGIPPAQALLRLRSYALGHTIPLTTLARALLTGRLPPESLDE
ncbi:GAF and ANTAR domain-containing protein [Streptomyces sp. NPDC020707]|uniref:GAF and ANTAR domain-containing protein n=1 Tax=Streptomyces TaxID=1883 RepID=UPI0028D14F81|nr:GAF and ANTAR domain-containing protein [Streptomyces sp. DSM 40484]